LAIYVFILIPPALNCGKLVKVFIFIYEVIPVFYLPSSALNLAGTCQGGARQPWLALKGYVSNGIDSQKYFNTTNQPCQEISKTGHISSKIVLKKANRKLSSSTTPGAEQ